jgi:hypothetical protein
MFLNWESSFFFKVVLKTQGFRLVRQSLKPHQTLLFEPCQALSLSHGSSPSWEGFYPFYFSLLFLAHQSLRVSKGEVETLVK